MVERFFMLISDSERMRQNKEYTSDCDSPSEALLKFACTPWASFLLLSAFSLLLALPLISCKNGGTEPPPPERTPRDYEWTVDTLAYPGSFQTNMRDIWGSSTTNVYVVGHNDQPGPATMFRYDGVSWKTTGFHAAEGGSISGPVSLTAIHGFSADDIWAVGERIYTNPNPPPTFLDSTLLVHFDGLEWTEFSARGGRLQSIWGLGSAGLWAGGNSTFLSYNGVAWENDSIYVAPEGTQFLQITGVSSSEVYAIGAKNDVTDPIDTVAFYLYLFDGVNWAIIDSVVRTPTSGPDHFGRGLFVVEGVLYSAGDGVFRRTAGQWVKILTGSSTFVDGYGTSSSNIFAVGLDSQVWHWNGVDWYRFPQFSGFDKYYSAVWTDGEQVFVVGNDGFSTYVLRGK